MSLLWPIIRMCVKSARQVAVVDDRRSMTYAQLLGGAMFMAERIESATARPHVGLLLPTSGATPAAVLGCWLARRTAIPFNYLLNPDELRYVIRDSEVDTILTVEPMLEFLGGGPSQGQGNATNARPPAIPDDINLIRLETLDYRGLPPLRWPPLLGDRELAVILYTSGTSGKPKGVMLSHGNLHSNVVAAIEHAQLTRADTFLGVLPQFHSFGLTALTLLPLYLGARIVNSARFVPKKIVELIREHRPDIFMGVPSMYGALLSVKDATAEDFASIRLPVSGGEPLPQAIYDACRERFGLKILEGYGLTETSPITHWSTPTRNKRHAVGRSLPDVTAIVVDTNDRPLPPDTDGEILLAGPNIMPGYFKLPDLTRQVFVEIDGRRFFRSGDIGRIDGDGFLFITGRKKEMLIIGGENVFPREIEEVLNRHDTVKDSAVIGRSDGMRGEVPIAFVEIHEGQAFDDSELRNWCRKHLAQYKVPREVRQVDSLPRSPTGKILRRQLKAD